MSEHLVIKKQIESEYQYGFSTQIDSDIFPPGLNAGVVRQISAKKNEPEFLLQFRLNALMHWQKMAMPDWAKLKIKPIDFQAISYYAAPKSAAKYKSLDEVDPEILRTFERLGVPLHEQKSLAGVAVDAVFDSVSVATTFKEELKKHGVIFCSFSDAVESHPELIKQYLGRIVPPRDNFFAALNSAVFTDGSFVYIPEGVKCPMELSTYFRINALNTGQFERTLIIADSKSSVSYLEGCTAPMRPDHQLHAAVVELYAKDDASIKYSTVQNWYPGSAEGQGGIYNFVTKRGRCAGRRSKISWTQVETGSAITWKYPSVVLQGDESSGEFYSVAVTKNYQQADTGSKMIHIGKNTTSCIVSKGISAGHSSNTYRGKVVIKPTASYSKHFTQCDSLIFGTKSAANTHPYIEVEQRKSTVEHEASTRKVDENQLMYCMQRGLSPNDAIPMIVNGFCKEVYDQLPLEFAAEVKQLMAITLEDSVG
ncbi:Fe-S cluster assembly protein SufB [Gammaproteobacteria bacterium]|nr:Fe-S cluster assembly protein SufB [Gammaproteobacteria bacterium]